MWSPALAAIAAPPSQQGAPQQGRSGDVLPFRRSSFKHTEGPIYSTTVAIGAAATQLPPIPIAAYGFMRGIWLRLVATGGTGTVAVAAQDAPFNAVSVTLQDVNNAPIYGPLPAGIWPYLVHKYGGYHYQCDPRQGQFSAVSAAGNFETWLWVPVEMLSRNGLGSLTNLNSAAAYQLPLTVSPSSTIYSTAPTGLPNLTVEVWLDAWAEPPAHDVLGNMLTRVPPALNTTQFWSLSSIPVQSGFQTPRLTRLGYFLRNLIFVFVNTSTGKRDETNFPDPVEIWVDGVMRTHLSNKLYREKIWHDFGYQPPLALALDSAGAQDTGVFPWWLNDDFGLKPGQELRHGYWPTLESSRIEVRGTFGAAGTLYVLTNDIAPAGSIFLKSTL